MLALDTNQAQVTRFDLLKNAVVAHEGRSAMTRLWPEWFPEGDRITEKDLESDDPIVWEMPEMTDDEKAEALRTFDQVISLTPDDLEAFDGLGR